MTDAPSPTSPEALRSRIRLMNALADAFERTAEFHARMGDEAYAAQKAGKGLREITVHFLNSRDEHRRSARTNRQDAEISQALLDHLEGRETARHTEKGST